MVATHQRIIGHGYTTEKSHLPKNQQYYMGRDKAYYIGCAGEKSKVFENYMERLFEKAPIAQTWYKTCDGLLSLSRKTEPSVFERACEIALANNIFSYRFVSNTIKNMQSNANSCGQIYLSLPETTENLRGKGYYRDTINPNKNQLLDISVIENNETINQ
jgi:hypothetical protein